MELRIANAAGFLGDNLDAPRSLVETTRVDYLTLEYLAELTMSILADQRQRDPDTGYARDFVDVLGSLGPALQRQPQLRIVSNAGGVNPGACARAASRTLVAAGLGDLPIAVVTGDDLLDQLDTLRSAGCKLEHTDTGQSLAELLDGESAANVVRDQGATECAGLSPISANAYLGAAPITEALAAGARLVLTGRLADASLAVGPAWHEFGWSSTDWDRLAMASVAGHLIECGAQVTGGYSTCWKDIDLVEVGYPIAELSGDGKLVITKPAGSGGTVNRRTVVEQLVYEIGDPQHYLTPDVDVDFISVHVNDLGSDRVSISGAKGRPPPDSYKVSLAYPNGYTASGQLLVYGPDAVEKAQESARLVFHRIERAGFAIEHQQVELLGTGAAVPGMPHTAGSAAANGTHELVLRLTVRDSRRAAVERFTKEISPLITSGPAGLAGYASGRSSVRPVYAYWPTSVPKSLIQPMVEVRRAGEWAMEEA